VGIGKEGLNRNEEVVLELHPHWWFFARQTTAVVGAVAVGLIVMVLSWPTPVQVIGAALILVSLGWFLARYIVWSSTWFVVTTDRLIRRSGVLKRQGIEIPLERVNTVFFRQTIFQRLIGAGDLEIESASEEGSQKIDSIRRPLNVQNEIYKQIEANENRKFDRIGRPGPVELEPTIPIQNEVAQTRQLEDKPRSEPSKQATPTSQSIPDQIEQLARLARDGILTEQEFQDKKRELLDRM